MNAPANAPAVPDDPAALMAEVMTCQARVSRAEAILSAARRRLGAALSLLVRARERGVALPPLAAAVVRCNEGLPAAGPEGAPGTLRERIVAVMEASPAEVFTPASLAPLVGNENRDSIRNTLLVLAARGRIDKLGEGRYQARQMEAPPAPEQSAT